MNSPNILTKEVLDAILSIFGAREDCLHDNSPIMASREEHHPNCNKYSLLVLASLFGSMTR